MTENATEWTWHHPAMGNQVILTATDVTEDEVRTYINQQNHQKNWEERSLRHRLLENFSAGPRRRLTNVRSIIHDRSKPAIAMKKTVYVHSHGSRYVYKKEEGVD